MDKRWINRLVERIESDGRSYNEISAQAGLGRNFIQQMIKYKKEPGADKLSRILNVLGDDASFYVILGVSISKEDIQFLQLFSSLPRQTRNAALDMFRTIAGQPRNGESQS